MVQGTILRIGQAFVHALCIASAGMKQAFKILLTMSKLTMQAGPEKRAVARYVRPCFF